MKKNYELSGSVRRGYSIYVPRPEDNLILKACMEDNSLILLTASRQMGKTSLTQGIFEQMKSNGCATAFIDFRSCPGRVVERNLVRETELWFYNLFVGLADEFGIEQEEVDLWLKEVEKISFTKRISKFFTSFIRKRIKKKIFIVFDELDFVQICGYYTDDFFTIAEIH